MTKQKLPLIGVTGDTHPEKDSDYYKAGDKYILSVVQAAKCLAVIIPPIGPALQGAELLSRLDGILFTGSLSDLEPHHYNQKPEEYDASRDPGRDATNLPLLRQAVKSKIPLLCICRGHQEFNVVHGGSIYQQIHLQDGVLDHRADPEKPYDIRYGPQHEIRILPGGVLEKINLGALTAQVNTIHGQAVNKIGAGLRLEAEAPDGVVEALSIQDREAFNISVQWHPEHHIALQEPLNRRIFDSFGAAARAYMREK